MRFMPSHLRDPVYSRATLTFCREDSKCCGQGVSNQGQEKFLKQNFSAKGNMLLQLKVSAFLFNPEI